MFFKKIIQVRQMNDDEKKEQEGIKRWLKCVIYEKIIKELNAIFDDSIEPDDIVKMATINAILKINFPYIFFVGFYRVCENKNYGKLLKIGPYQGESIAISEIIYSSTFGRGVCAKSALQEKTINVPDVSKFCGYIACDTHTKSEIVAPVMRQGKLIAVLDIDSIELNSFDEVDEFYLEYLLDKYFDGE